MDAPSQIEIFKKKLDDIRRSNTDIIKTAQESIILCRSELNSLRNFVKSQGFKSQDEEIQFFKRIKPIPASYLIYHLKIHAFESRISKTSLNLQQKFIDNTRNKTYQFLMNHLDFVNYIEQGQTHLDRSYFTRNQSIQIMMVHTDDYFYDLDFNTSHDMLLAKIAGYKRFIDYLENRIDDYPHKASISKLKWTSSKVALTELIYALYHSRVINNGNSEIKELAKGFQNLFNIDLGDFYKTYSEIRLRKKSRTKFLDDLSIALSSEIDKDDS